MADFGVKRVPLPAADFGLDADGWVDVRTEITVGMMVAASQDGAEHPVKTSLLAYCAGWSIKKGGLELAFTPETAMQLPWRIFQVVNKEIESVSDPFVAGAATPSGQPSSASAPDRDTGSGGTK